MILVLPVPSLLAFKPDFPNVHFSPVTDIAATGTRWHVTGRRKIHE
jgi:hypothetical protein